MSSNFQNPKNPLAAMWASATESYLRDTNPGLSIREIRRLPFMRGVYEHLGQLAQKRRVQKPTVGATAKETGARQQIAQAAYYSQAFFDVALTAVAYSKHPYDDLYELFIEGLEYCHELDGSTNFSTDDWYGFGLCVIVYIWMLGGPGQLDTVAKKLFDYLVRNSQLTDEQKDKINEFWSKPHYGLTEFQYRDADDPNYQNYKAIDWKIPNDAQIVIIGDWGTSMDDAKAFLKAIWRQAYLNNPGGKVVFLHLGDIYYCGLPYECYYYFQDVFINVGKELLGDPDVDPNRFDPNPPIFTIPGNHEYYSYGYGYFELIDNLQQGQRCSFFCLRTENDRWQFLGMDTGQADGNGLLSFMQSFGGIVKDFASRLPDWDWLNWITNLAITTYEDFFGPFQPTLRDSELRWMKDRLDEFGGKTIMLSHHQLFSRRAQIDHTTPQYLNTWLDNQFSPYYKDRIAAWYWGHEHTFAPYIDGLMGLNKGRLLGSSSYEVTDESDDPYKKTYPMVVFAPYMDDGLIDQTNGIYSHAGAIMTQKGPELDVKYYQFPSWSQLDDAPTNPQLTEIREVAERITETFTSLKPSWIGDIPIKENTTTTDHSPSVTVWDETLYLVFVNGNNKDGELMLCTINTSDIHLENRELKGNWSSPQPVQTGGNTITTLHSPAVIAVNRILYLFYVDEDNILRGLTRPVSGSNEWTSLNLYHNGQPPLEVGDAAPAICFFQGRIYVVYREKNTHTNLCWAYYEVTTGDFKDFGKLQDIAGDTLKSPNTPAIAADAYHIYMTYQKKDGSIIRWAVGSPSSTAPERNHNNVSWIDQGNIEGDHYTQTGMSLVYASGVFIMVYTSSNGNLTQCALTETGKDSIGLWVGSNTVKPNQNRQNSTARSKYVAQLGTTIGGGVLVYRGLNHDEIYWAYY